MNEAMGVGDADRGVLVLTSLRVLWPVTMIVAGGPSFTISFTRELLMSMSWLSTKCDNSPRSEVMVNFSGSGLPQAVRNG